MNLLKLLVVVIAVLPVHFASAQQLIGDFSGGVDVTTEGFFVLSNQSGTQRIPVFIKVSYKGGLFETKLAPNGTYQQVMKKPPNIEADSYIGYRENWIRKKDGTLDMDKNKQGMLIQKVVGIGMTSLGLAYIVKGDGFDLIPSEGDTKNKHSILDNGKSIFSFVDAKVKDTNGKDLPVYQTTTNSPIPNISSDTQQIYVLRSRDKQGIPMLISTSQFSGAESHKSQSIPKVQTTR